jgi:hypothetical protein
MARLKQTKATATSARPAATPARRTQAPPPTNEDPPAQGSRQPLVAVTRNNQVTQQNDYHSQDGESNDEPWMPNVRASVRSVPTAARGGKKIKKLVEALKSLLAKPLKTELDNISIATARYELKGLLKRREQLQAARATGSSADSILSYTGKGKGKATAQSLPAPGSDVPAASSPAVDPGDQEGSEDEMPPPPVRRSLRNDRGHQDGQASQNAFNNQEPDSDDNLPSQQRWSPHNPRKYWDIHGITRESKHHYKICWKGETEIGEKWDDLWVRKAYVCQKSYEDWQKHKRDPIMWKVFED